MKVRNVQRYCISFELRRKFEIEFHHLNVNSLSNCMYFFILSIFYYYYCLLLLLLSLLHPFSPLTIYDVEIKYNFPFVYF